MKSPAHPIHLVLGLVIWSFWFIAVYGALSVGCSQVSPQDYGNPLNRLNLSLLLLTLLTAAVLLVLGIWCWRADDKSSFYPRLAAGIYCTAFIATLAVGSPIISLPPCY